MLLERNSFGHFFVLLKIKDANKELGNEELSITDCLKRLTDNSLSTSEYADLLFIILTIRLGNT
jgi:hypothetical protein